MYELRLNCKINIICFMKTAGEQMRHGFKVQDLITCKSKVQVVFNTRN